MVSSSRKKNKGRDRKAKKAEAERTRTREKWWGLAVGDKKFVGKAITCNHGFTKLVIDDLDQPVLTFLDDFIVRNSFSVETLVQALETTNGKTILNDERYREMVVNIMIRIGTNLLLNCQQVPLKGALKLAKSIFVLEHYDGGDSLVAVMNSRRLQSKMRDLNISTSTRRDALKFYSKRVSCSCLKKMYQEARRTQPKMGRCRHCLEEKERVALSVCSRCMITQYCSRECQVAHWPEHKRPCDMYVLAHQQQISCILAGNAG